MNIKNRLRKIYFSIARIPFEHKEISLISNNCLAGCILHDFGLRFDTPTINLFIPFPDYIKFLSDLKGFVNKEIVDITNGSNYPIGLLGGGKYIYISCTTKPLRKVWMHGKGVVNVSTGISYT